tara:strand:- start:120 stop:1490 length:1371 start_codon:yes stop_codon:yes gene_type:complete
MLNYTDSNKTISTTGEIVLKWSILDESVTYPVQLTTTHPYNDVNIVEVYDDQSLFDTSNEMSAALLESTNFLSLTLSTTDTGSSQVIVTVSNRLVHQAVIENNFEDTNITIAQTEGQPTGYPLIENDRNDSTGTVFRFVHSDPVHDWLNDTSNDITEGNHDNYGGTSGHCNYPDYLTLNEDPYCLYNKLFKLFKVKESHTANYYALMNVTENGMYNVDLQQNGTDLQQVYHVIMYCNKVDEKEYQIQPSIFNDTNDNLLYNGSSGIYRPVYLQQNKRMPGPYKVSISFYLEDGSSWETHIASEDGDTLNDWRNFRTWQEHLNFGTNSFLKIQRQGLTTWQNIEFRPNADDPPQFIGVYAYFYSSTQKFEIEDVYEGDVIQFDLNNEHWPLDKKWHTDPDVESSYKDVEFRNKINDSATNVIGGASLTTSLHALTLSNFQGDTSLQVTFTRGTSYVY